MSRQFVFPTYLLVILFVIALSSCSGAKPVLKVLHEKENLAEVTEMDYFPPFFKFTTRDLPSSTTLRHVVYTNKIVDSILNSHYKYRIADKIENNSDLLLVKEMSTLFEQFKKGNVPVKIPPLVKAELEQQDNRYALALYFEPDFVFWKSGPRMPISRPDSALVFNNTRVHALVFDKVDSKILFYGQTRGNRMKHYVWNLKGCFRRLYEGMFPEFED